MSSVDKRSSLRELCRIRIIDGMLKQVNGNNPLLFVVLVCDSRTLSLVSSSLTSADLVANRVAVVDKLDKNREPLMNMDAIYFLSPTAQNFQQLLGDFPDLTKFKPKYRRQHVFLNSTCPDDVMGLLSARKDVVKRMTTFVELNLDFVARDDRVFHFSSQVPAMLSYFPKRNDEVMGKDVKKLLSLFASLQDKPRIRFLKNSIDSYCPMFAVQLDRELEEYWKNASRPPNQMPCTCLIVDRGLDAVAPFLHDFGYEALCMDLLGGQDDPSKEINTRNDTFTYDTVTAEGEALHKSIVLNDDLWRGLRHKSMLAVKDIVMVQMTDLKENNEIARFMQNEEDGVETEATARILRQLPAYQEKVGKYGSQLTLITRTMKIIQDCNLNKIGTIEQDIACAIQSTGEPVNIQKLMVGLAQTLMDPSLPPALKLRVVLLYVLNMRGVTPEHREKMLATAGFDGDHRRVFKKMLSLGLVDGIYDNEKLPVHQTRTPTEEQLCYSEMIQHDRKQRVNPLKSFKHELFRFQPRIRMVAQRICTNTLDKELFPYVKGNDLDNHPGIEFGRKGGRRPRLVIYFIGGMTYSETRTAFDLSSKYNVDIFMGSESLVNPENMIERAINDRSWY
eukprot:CAMPEP_0178997078 /NCGR_PEP_ID=MMETSP0795-20121207/8732_1 /TAXON_ID=88552 /ORGANISM="Amoebophrya sp., Strain Ameob2" /LENGTH=618 /DNA_ID=CAMNT_0020689555 /DNA_START=287 /DNA_END=2143 /DNA_ORIENTATION=-